MQRTNGSAGVRFHAGFANLHRAKHRGGDVYFWLKFLHIAMVGTWFLGLFFLPRLFVAYRSGAADADRAYYNRLTNLIFFYVSTPAAVLAMLLGMALMLFIAPAGWLVLKLAVVSIAVLLHVYCGLYLYEMSRGGRSHGPLFFRVLGWVPLVLLLAIAGLTAAKPDTLPSLPAPPQQGPGPLPFVAPAV